jgi:hypothetical protein
MSDPGRNLPRLVCERKKLDRSVAPGISDFWREISPTPLVDAVTAGRPRQFTWFKTAWDPDQLHVLFFCEDDHAWATLRQRDAPLYKEEVVEVFLDPVGDLETYFEIEVNPLNAVCDLVLRRNRTGYRKEFAWDCAGLQTAVAVDESSWTVEMAIPFESLMPGLPRESSPWRANFFRIDRPASGEPELSAWSPPGRPRFHLQEKFGVLEFAGHSGG